MNDVSHIILPHAAQHLRKVVGNRRLQPACPSRALFAGVIEDLTQLLPVGIVDIQHIKILPQFLAEQAVRAPQNDQRVALSAPFEHADLSENEEDLLLKRRSGGFRLAHDVI